MRILAVIATLAACIFISPQLEAAPNRKDNHKAPSSFTVLASDSLDLVLTDLLRRYSTRSDNVVTAVFGAPDELVQAILAGDPADLIILEDPDQLKALRLQGLVDASSEAELAGNRLVFAAFAGHRLARKFPEPVALTELMKDYRELEMVMADPATLPSGKAAQEAFTKLGLWDKVVPLLIRAGGAKDALYLVGRGERTGVIYYSDTVDNPEVAVLADIPADLHQPIRYEGMVVAGDDMQQARDFLTFLQSLEAQGIFLQHGFSIPEAKEKSF